MLSSSSNNPPSNSGAGALSPHPHPHHLLLHPAASAPPLAAGAATPAYYALDEREALQRLLDPREQPERTPAKLVQLQVPVRVLADTEAAQGL